MAKAEKCPSLWAMSLRPQEIIKVYGADVLRLWAASVDYRNDIKIGENAIKQLLKSSKRQETRFGSCSETFMISTCYRLCKL